MQPKKILLPTDFSDCATAALDHALLLAHRFEAELHLLHIEVSAEPIDKPIDKPTDEPTQRSAEALMDQLVISERGQRLLAQSMHLRLHESRLVAPEVGPAVVQYAQRHEIDLIVIGTHGRVGLSHLFLGSVAEEVVRTAPCPVLTCRQPPLDVRGYDRLLVPYDFSADSDAALQQAASLANTFGGQIEVLHVMAPPVPLGGEFAIPLPTVQADLQQESQSALELRTRALQLPAHVSLECQVLQGPVAWQITEYAEDVEANLIVMGSHGLSGLRRLLLGSVSERVVRTAPCAVLVLRADDVDGSASYRADSHTGDAKQNDSKQNDSAEAANDSTSEST